MTKSTVDPTDTELEDKPKTPVIPDNVQQAQELKWMCEKCGETVEGTAGKFLNFCNKHPKKRGCSVVLVNGLNEVLATSITDARRKGLIEKKGGAQPEKKPDGYEGKVPKDGQPLAIGFYKTERVELDARLFLYRDIFVQEQLVPADISMGVFLLGCVESLLEVTGRKIAIVQTKGGHN